MTWIGLSLQWYVVLMAVSWSFAPWARLLAPAMSDRAVFIARPIGLLATVYPLWLLSSVVVVPFTTTGLWITVGVTAVSGWLLVWRKRHLDRDWLRLLVMAEAFSFVTFALYAAWRGYAPQILNTEKPMDIAFLASTARATVMPPLDPWMAGETINYYYLGYLLQGSLSRMSGVVPTVGFNLALATTFSMTVTAVFGLGYVAVRCWASTRQAVVAGVLAVALVVLGGNLYSAREFLSNPAATIEASWWGGVGWNASRIVVDSLPGSNSSDGLSAAGTEPPVDTINEFPAFSFVLGDLHPHVLALPFTVVAIYLALSLFTSLRGCTLWTWSNAVRVTAAGWVAGSLYMLNSWDYPTYLLVIGGGGWLGMQHLGGRSVGGGLAFLLASSIVCWLPFFVGFTPPVGVSTQSLPAALDGVPVVSTVFTALGSMRWEHTSFAEFFTVFGVPYGFSIWFLAHGMSSPSNAPEGTRRFDDRSVGIFAASVLGFGLVLDAPVVVLCGLPLVLAALQHSERRLSHGPATLLFAVAYVLVLGTEFFYIQDIFGNRMNTLFKVYYQAWTLLGIATAIALVSLWREAGLSRGAARRLTRPALGVVVPVALAATVLYPVLSASDYRSIRGPVHWTGLDGMAYIGELAPGELAAMHWIRDNASEDDVLLEALGCSYQVNSGLPTSGMSAFTGVPTVLGWPGHERQWHLGDVSILQEQQRRAGLFDQLYSLDGDPIRNEFGVTLIYVGPFERDGTSACDSAGPYQAVQDERFPGPNWVVAFAAGDATVYRRTAETLSSTSE